QGGIVFVNPHCMPDCVHVEASPEFHLAPAFYGKNCVFPNLNATFEHGQLPPDTVCNSAENGKLSSGIMLENSSLYIHPNNGFTDFPYMGLCGVGGSNVIAHHCHFDRCGNREDLQEDSASQDWYG